MIEVVQGNLLEARTEALVNTVNTVGVMGKGVALQFKRAFPENFKAYERACKANEVKLGRMHVFETDRLTPRLIINFPTKRHWRSRSKLADIEAGLEDLVRVIQYQEIRSIAVPPLGCGNGGLDWQDVRQRIESALQRLDDVHVLVFEPRGAPDASRMPVGSEPPRMTPGRAALIGLLARFTSQGAEATLLAIQKLMYFLQAAGEDLRLQYVPAHYGPYAENLNHVLQAVEGHYLVGYGDRSARVDEAQPLELLPGAEAKAESFLEDHAETLERFQRVTDLIEGFESPYGLELLATVHLVVARDPGAARSPATVVERVQSWSRRKEHLFSVRHIRIAWNRLRDQGWLPERSDSAAG